SCLKCLFTSIRIPSAISESLSSNMTALVFFLLAVARRDLHSFPTRRSSDLDDLVGIVVEDVVGPEHVRDRDIAEGLAPFAVGDRSEEHTSELQSRFDLVCRLLLEKKKI